MMNLFHSIIAPKLTKAQRIAAIVLFFAFILSLETGIALYTNPAVISPASGVALAGLVIGGIELWQLIFLATLAVYLLNGYAVVSVISLPIAYTLQATAGAYILKRLGFRPMLERLRDMLMLMGVALATSTILPAIGLSAKSLDHRFFGGPLAMVTLEAWWTGTIMSILILTPFLVRWIGKPRFTRTQRQIIELSIAFAFLLVINFLLFWTTVGRLGDISLVYILLIPLMWIALRFGSRFTTLAMLLTAIFALSGIFFGATASMATTVTLGSRLFQMEVLINILTLIFFILSAIEDERKTAVSKLESHIQKLEEAIGMRDEFISVASHELKTPVTTLKIYSQVMQRQLQSKGDMPLASQVSKMDKQLNKLITLVEDLLNVSRSRIGKLEFHMEEFDLNQLVRETTSDIQSTSHKHALGIEGAVLRPIYGDKDRIAQVIINLLNNAIKYSPDASSVKVEISDAGDAARVSVRDFGIGIDPKHHEKIFGLFYRVSDEGTNTFPGFGIGLHISHEIIKRHNGVLSVKSIKDEGSEFSFTLPYGEEKVQSTE